MASTLSLQQLIDPIRTYPEVKVLMDVGGFGSQPALFIANTVMQKILSKPMDWKWNRAYVPNFLTISLQQDYVTNVTDMGWLEQGWRVDINNNAVPKPIFTMESVRDISQSSFQANPFNLSWLPNRLAQMGTWQSETAYQAGYGQASMPRSPISQFIDENDNILFINSNSLGLSINSPGYSGSTISTTPPYGTSGTVEPVLPADSAPGTTVVDGTVTWTVADPDGYAIRLVPIPPFTGLCWFIFAVYQKSPPRLTSMTQTLDPIPDDLSYLFQQGFLAFSYQHSAEPAAQRKFPMAYAQWEAALVEAVGGANREREDAIFYPSQSLQGTGPWSAGLPLGPAYPFDAYGWG